MNKLLQCVPTDLPIMGFSTKSISAELTRLKSVGIKLRPELDKPEWGIENVFKGGQSIAPVFDYLFAIALSSFRPRLVKTQG